MLTWEGNSDLLTLYHVYCSWKRHVRTTSNSFVSEFCQKNFLNAQSLFVVEDLKAQFAACLEETGYVRFNTEEKEALHRYFRSVLHAVTSLMRSIQDPL